MTSNIDTKPATGAVALKKSRSAKAARRGAVAVTAPPPEAVRLVLDGTLTIRTIEEAHSRLIEAMHDDTRLEIDCSAADDVDVSFIQLLLAARASARKRGRSVALAAPASGALLDALTRGGFLAAAGNLPAEDDAFWLKGASAQ
jgi:ABC-type transporter Mla MlaB component